MYSKEIPKNIRTRMQQENIFLKNKSRWPPYSLNKEAKTGFIVWFAKCTFK